METKRVNGKVVLDIENAYIDDCESTTEGDKVLVGLIPNHYYEWYSGKICTTGVINRVEDNVVETNQHVYNVLSWDENRTPRQMELFD